MNKQQLETLARKEQAASFYWYGLLTNMKLTNNLHARAFKMFAEKHGIQAEDYYKQAKAATS